MAENKVIKLQKQILELTKEINKNGEATKKQAKELEKLEKQYNKLSSKQMPQYRKRHEEVNKQLQSANKLTAQATKRTQSFGSRIGGAIKTLGAYGIAYQLVNAATRLFTELTVGSAKQAIKFQKSVANLGAVAGVSGKELENLSRNALDVAGATKFTADEIIGLQTELSKLGFTSQEVIEATQGIAFAAQALNAPLNSVAEQVGKVINQFDLLAEQSVFIGDVLVTSINESALSFDSFGTAIQYVGPIAKNLGLTFEQTAGAMAVLADNGFTASRIGTGLRGIFTELGKTSADVERSLKSLAEQNISLSEAVDLVGKRNAAQLITLLKNIEAIDETNGKYYQQGRALEAAAKQTDTWSGKVELLNSAFRETQISIGNFVAESGLLDGILQAFFPKASKTAQGLKLMREVGFDNFTEGAKEVADGVNAVEVAFDLLGDRVADNDIAFSELKVTMTDVLGYSMDERGFNLFYTGLASAGSEGIATAHKLQGLIDKLNEQGEEMLKQKIITEGQAEVTNKYADTVERLTNAHLNLINVNSEVDRTSEEVREQLEEVNMAVETGEKLVTDWVTGRVSSVKMTEDEILKYKGLQSQLQSYLDTLANLTFDQDAADQARQKRVSEESKAARKRIKEIKNNTKEEVDSLNERARVETAIARTAEEKADIEIERTRLVSQAYEKQAAAIRDLSSEYETQKDVIEEAAKSSDKLAAILTSDIFKDVEGGFKDYEKSIKSAQKALKDKKITQEEYNQILEDERGSLVGSIDLFRELAGTSPELEQFFNIILNKFDGLGSSTEETTKSIKEQIKEAFSAENIRGILSQFVSSADEVLSEFNDTQLENTKNRLESEIDAIKNRYKIEEDVLKAQLDNQLITESQFRSKSIQLRKNQLREENEIDRQIFEAEKQQDRQDAVIDGAAAIAQAFVTVFRANDPATAAIKAAISSAIIGVQTTAQVSAINSRQFFPKKFEQGGMVSGPSHAEGGVPFTVQGNSGYEMEGGEFIVNKKATSMHRDLLERINNSYRTNPQVGRMKFANGGIVQGQANESVDYLKAIAEATTSTAIGVSRPVRAYVSDKDLRSDSNERIIRDRNDRI
jgi:hypothetical protein